MSECSGLNTLFQLLLSQHHRRPVCCLLVSQHPEGESPHRVQPQTPLSLIPYPISSYSSLPSSSGASSLSNLCSWDPNPSPHHHHQMHLSPRCSPQAKLLSVCWLFRFTVSGCKDATGMELIVREPWDLLCTKLSCSHLIYIVLLNLTVTLMS